MGETEHFTWQDAKDAENRRKHNLPLRFAEVVLSDTVRLDASTRLAASCVG